MTPHLSSLDVRLASKHAEARTGQGLKLARIFVAGDFVGPGEENSARVLERDLPHDWIVVTNREIARANSSREADFIVVGRHAIFAIEDKYWWGTIHGNESSWVLDSGVSFPSPLRQAQEVSKRLLQHLEQRAEGATQLGRSPKWLHPKVLLSHPDVQVEVDDARIAEAVLLIGSVVERLIAEDDAQAERCSIAPARQEIVRVLTELPGRPEIPSRIAPYDILESLSQSGPIRTLRAQHDDGSERILKLVKRPQTLQEQVRHSYEEALLREYQTLQQLSDSGVVPQVDPYLTWDQDQFYVFVTHPVEGATLRAERADAPPDQKRVQTVAAAAFHALARVHDAGIIHRNINPDNVVTGEGAVRFTDFDIARIPSHETVAPMVMDLELEPDDTYLAPELRDQGLHAATPASDVYSLAVTLWEWVYGEVPGGNGSDGGTSRRADLASSLRMRLERELADCLSPDPGQRPSARDVATSLSIDVARPFFSEGDMIDGRYRVDRELGSGASAITYKVQDTHIDRPFAIKVIRDPRLADSLAKNEFLRLLDVAHEGLPKVFEVNPADKPYHLKLEYVRGSSLKDLGGTYHRNRDVIARVGIDILGALQALHQHGVLHRDVSAGNILVPDEETGHAKLIDFGLASPIDLATSAVGTPLYRAPEMDASTGEVEWDQSCDLYSLAVVLFEHMTGRLPYRVEGGIPRKGALIQPTPEEEQLAGARVLRVLLRACDPNRSNRYRSADELLAAFTDALNAPDGRNPDGEPRINPTVDSLRALYRNSAIGNADNRGLDTKFAIDTYVDTLLDLELTPSVRAGGLVAVFLSGNPGDGKTAYLQHLYAELTRGDSRIIQEENLSGWILEVGSRRIRAVYDASKSHEGQGADEVLVDALRPLEGKSKAEPGYTVLVAINDGRLLDFFERHGETHYSWLWRQVQEQVFSADDGESAGAVVVVDLKRRTPAAGGRDSIFDRILDQFVAEERWSICEGCVARFECPMRFNALTFQDAAVADQVRERLRDLLIAVHLRRERRPTVRDLRSTAAFILTHDLACEDVHEERGNERSPAADTSRLYFNATFDASGSPDLLLDEWAQLDPAATAAPELDRFIYFHRKQPHSYKLESAFLKPEHREALSVDIGLRHVEPWMKSIKRRYAFEAASSSNGMPSPHDVLPYRFFRQFVETLRRPDRDPALELVLAGISRADGVPYAARGDGLALRISNPDELELVVVKQFPAAEFLLTSPSAPDGYVEGIPDILALEHRPATGSASSRLRIGLDLFEYLGRAAHGLLPGAEEQKALGEDLVNFKQQLLLHPTHEVVLVEGGRESHQVHSRDGVIYRKAPT